MPSRNPKSPDPIVLALGQTTLATAYARRPPTDRLPDWSWRMAYEVDGERVFAELGRVPTGEVSSVLLRRWLDLSQGVREPSRTSPSLDRALEAVRLLRAALDHLEGSLEDMISDAPPADQT